MIDHSAVKVFALCVLTLSAYGATAVSAQASAPRRTASPRPTATQRPAIHPPAVPGLSIGITDGRHQARTGDRLAYVVRIGDNGTVSVPHLKVTLTLPPYLTFISASHHGVATAGKVTWRDGLRAGHTARFSVSALVRRTPAGVARLASVACATTDSGRPVVCAAHLDQLPAAADATGSRVAAPSSGRSLLRYAGWGLVLLTAIALAVFAATVRRRRHSLTAAGRGQGSGHRVGDRRRVGP